MDLFNKQITLNINSTLFLIITGVVVLVVILLVVLIIRNKRHVNTKPKYGFLGKSLYGLLSVALLSASLIFTIGSINNEQIFEIQAKKTLQADIFTNVLLQDSGKIYVDFKAIPTVDGKVWGTNGARFDIYWTFTGSNGQTYSYIETARSGSNRSGLQKYFEPGSYRINVAIVFENETYTFTKDTSF
jgi:hypothetical protein